MGNAINPQIKKVEIGVRDLREINVLPLSIGDQTELSEIISKAVKSFVESGNLADEAFIAGVLELLSTNISKILKLITDDKTAPKQLLKEITNNQALRIAEIVYEENYSQIVKKVQGLVEKMGPKNRAITRMGTSILEGLQPISSDDIPSTESKTSSESPGETGA